MNTLKGDPFFLCEDLAALQMKKQNKLLQINVCNVRLTIGLRGYVVIDVVCYALAQILC